LRTQPGLARAEDRERQNGSVRRTRGTNRNGPAVLPTPRPAAFLPKKGTQMNATPTAPARQRKPRPRPARSIRLCVRPDAHSAGVVRIRVGREAHDYLLTEFAADFGRGFLLQKIGHGDAYHVHLDSGKRTCECKGHLKWGYCKHADGLAALVAAG